jgi:hypothetical protein
MNSFLGVITPFFTGDTTTVAGGIPLFLSFSAKEKEKESTVIAMIKITE